MVIALLVIHLLCFAAALVLMKLNMVETRLPLWPVLLFVPVFGFLIVLLNERYERMNRMGRKQIDLDKLKIQEIRYKRIHVDDSGDESITVPLEEAMVINDADTRRRLMMDILQRDPESYIDLLQRARMSDDTELTHYATTTMMDIQGKYESDIRNLEQEYKATKKTKTLRRLRRTLQDYVDSQLLSGTILIIYREKLDEVLSELCKLEPEHARYAYAYLENKIELKQTGLEEQVEALIRHWPEDEKTYQVCGDYYRMCGRGDKVRAMIGDMKEKGVHLSSEGKRWANFWLQGEKA